MTEFVLFEIQFCIYDDNYGIANQVLLVRRSLSE